MDIVKAVEEEYWAIQYETTVMGYREPTFWPSDGEGKYASEAAAIAGSLVYISRGQTIRILHVTRRTEFGDPVTEIREP